MTQATHHVVIIGAGFGGLNAAQALAGAPVRVTVIDRRNFHLFQALLYQVATGGLSPANIAAPVRSVLKKQKNATVLLGDVTGIDVATKQVQLRDGSVGYDTLIVAAGGRNNYFGKTHWEPLAPGLKSLEDATEIRRRILLAFENAEKETDPVKREALMTFVVVGGGATGVELAGTLSEIARHTLREDFRNIRPESARIILLDSLPRVLTQFDETLSEKARKSLTSLNVEVRTGVMVTDITPDGVSIKAVDAPEKTEKIAATTVLWAAGVQASPLGKMIGDATGAKLDKGGYVVVEKDFTVAGHPEIFVIGDLARYYVEEGKALPGVAPVAMQSGNYVARVVSDRVRGRTTKPFKYNDRGSMATIGRSMAVADIKGIRFSGFLAWMAWLFIHLMFLVRFENRVLVFMQWAWNYITFNRAARLITGEARPVETAAVPPATKTETPPATRRSSSSGSRRQEMAGVN